jgi:hypothetical protein
MVDFIEVDVTKEMMKYAEDRSKITGELNNSITRGEGNVAGFLGKKAVSDYLRNDRILGKGHDLVDEGYKIAIKAKLRKDKPRQDHDCSVTYPQAIHQDCDGYIFTSVNNSYTKVWIVGYMDRLKLLKIAKILQKNETYGSNAFRCHEKCHNVEISQLDQLPLNLYQQQTLEG